jgi:hypothetical protein
MTDSFPLTAAALRKHASDFHVYERQLALELGGLSGLQINELTFARLTKPDPLRLFGSDCGREGVLMLGTDQRDMLVPKLAETLLVLPPGGYVLDIGPPAMRSRDDQSRSPSYRWIRWGTAFSGTRTFSALAILRSRSRA